MPTQARLPECGAVAGGKGAIPGRGDQSLAKLASIPEACGVSESSDAKTLQKSVPIRIIGVPLLRGGAVWQLVGLITRRSQVQILPPLPAR
jgi:hypothetical protein